MPFFRLARRPLVWCALFLMFSIAGAQDCPSRDVQIEQPGVGVVQADALDFEGDVALLTAACFRLGTFDLDAARASADEAGVTADNVNITGAGVTGLAGRATVRGETTVLTNLKLRLTLPAGSLPNLPLPAGAYDLQTDAAELRRGRLGAAQATLRRLSDGETYRLQHAVLEGQHLTADAVDLVRLSAVRLDAAPGAVRTGPAEIGLCRDPAARELTLRAANVLANSRGTTLGGARLALFGLPLPLPPGLTLPLSAGGATLSESAQTLAAGAQVLNTRLIAARPQLLLADGRYGIRDLPLLDSQDTRLNAVLHPGYLEFGVRSVLDGADFALGVFEDPYSEIAGSAAPDIPVPQLALARFPTGGPQFGLALHGGGLLSEFRAGYAAALGTPAFTLRAEGDVGGAYQLGRADPFAHGQLSAGLGGLRALGSGVLSWRASTALDLYAFPDAGQLAWQVEGGANYVAPGLSVSLAHLARGVWGAAPLPGLLAGPAQQSTLNVALTPDLKWGPLTLARLGYLYSYDWRAGAPSVSALSGGALATFGPLTVAPAASYDWAVRRLDLSAEATLDSRCFRYGAAVDLYRQPTSGGLSVRLIFNLR